MAAQDKSFISAGEPFQGHRIPPSGQQGSGLGFPDAQPLPLNHEGF